MNMTWEQKLAALMGLAGWNDVWLAMRNPGDWYVNVGKLAICDGSTLTSPTQSAPNPEMAVELCWHQLTEEEIEWADMFGYQPWKEEM